MRRARVGAWVGASLGASAGAWADGTATWEWEVVTNNGNGIVEPGESAFVTLSILTEPDQGAEFLALAASIFDTLGGANADKGQIVTWQVLNDLDYLTGDLTSTDGVSLFHTNVGQLSVYGPFFTDNPLEVLTFQWKPSVEGAYTVEYDTNTDAMVMWEGFGDDAHDVWYDVVEGHISFQVVPSPAGVVLIGAGALGAVARRRRGS